MPTHDRLLILLKERENIVCITAIVLVKLFIWFINTYYTFRDLKIVFVQNNVKVAYGNTTTTIFKGNNSQFIKVSNKIYKNGKCK